MLIALFTAAVVPALMLMWFFHARDVFREPPRVLWTTFALGIATIPPVLLVAWPLMTLSGIPSLPNPYLAGTLRAFVGAAIPEETFKFLVLFLYAHRNHHFDEPMDGVVYGVAASLGFATLENILYVGGGGFGMAIGRAITAVPAHASWGAVMGYFVGQAKFRPAERSKLMLQGVFGAMLLHGLYDVTPLVFKSFGAAGRKPPVPVIVAMILFWLVVFVFGVVYALLLGRRLRRAQLELGSTRPAPAPALGRPVPAPVVAPPLTAGARGLAWLLVAVGFLLGGAGGLMTLGVALAVVMGAARTELGPAAMAFILFGLLPLGLGSIALTLGVRRLNQATTAVTPALA
jgi:RsiW-degrading membrane proteinase PrsW (M82 family)